MSQVQILPEAQTFNILNMNKISEDKKWQAEYDAETMARYEEIMADAKRKAAAIKAAKEKASDLNKRADIMNRVVKGKTTPRKKN